MDGLWKNSWLLYAFLCLFFWGFFTPQLTLAAQALGTRFLIVNGGLMFVVGIFATLFSRVPFPHDFVSFKKVSIGGVASMLGYLFFALALGNAKKHDNANAAVIICGMWIALGVIMNWAVLGETMTIAKWFGVLCAAAAVVLISL